MLIIIGSGPTGLSCAYKLGTDYLIVEKETYYGGLGASIYSDGFTFDYSGHLLHLRWDETKKFVLDILKDNLIEIERNAQIYLDKCYTDYPFQVNLYNLPPEIKSECLNGFLKAQLKKKISTKNFKIWSYETFGDGICKYFMFPYNEKLLSYPLESITTDWLGEFVPQPNINQVLNGALKGKIKNIGYNARFYYPLNGGIYSLTRQLLSDDKRLMLKKEVIKVSFKEKKLFFKDGSVIKYSKLVNTMPLKHFIEISDAPEKVKGAARDLKHNTVYVLNLGIKKTNFKQHWIYFPEKRFPFYRVGFYTNFSRNLAPDGYDSLYVELSVKENDYVDIQKKYDDIIKALAELKIIKTEKDVITKLWSKIGCGYVIYDDKRSKSLETIFGYLKTNEVISTGRYGGWKYSFMEENIRDGFDTAKKILGGRL